MAPIGIMDGDGEPGPRVVGVMDMDQAIPLQGLLGVMDLGLDSDLDLGPDMDMDQEEIVRVDMGLVMDLEDLKEEVEALHTMAKSNFLK